MAKVKPTIGYKQGYNDNAVHYPVYRERRPHHWVDPRDTQQRTYLTPDERRHQEQIKRRQSEINNYQLNERFAQKSSILGHLIKNGGMHTYGTVMGQSAHLPSPQEPLYGLAPKEEKYAARRGRPSINGAPTYSVLELDMANGCVKIRA